MERSEPPTSEDPPRAAEEKAGHQEEIPRMDENGQLQDKAAPQSEVQRLEEERGQLQNQLREEKTAHEAEIRRLEDERGQLQKVLMEEKAALQDEIRRLEEKVSQMQNASREDLAPAATPAPRPGQRSDVFRFSFMTRGVMGDMNAMVLLARRLQARGHEVQAIIPSGFVEFFSARGIEARAAFPNTQELFKTVKGISKNLREDEFILAAVAEHWKRQNPDMLVDPLNAIREFSPDLVLWFSDGAAALAYEVEVGVPAVEVRSWGMGDHFGYRQPARPAFVTTSPLFDNVGKLSSGLLVEGAGFDEANGAYMIDRYQNFNHITSLDGVGMRMWFAPNINLWFLGNPVKFGGKATYLARGGSAGKPPKDGWHICDDGKGVLPAPRVTLVSETCVHQTGAWLASPDDPDDTAFVESELKGSLGPLLAFLDAGPAPVLLGWGSVMERGLSPSGMLLLALRALRMSQRRGVILGGWAGLHDVFYKSVSDLAAGGTPEEDEEANALVGLVEWAQEHCFILASAPHHWLMPRCSCVVHHGSAGTTHAALHAGKPSVVTPIGVDQPKWAHLVEKHGVGIGFKKQLQHIKPLELSNTIADAEKMTPAAEKLGESLRKEGGVAKAAEVLEAFVLESVGPGKTFDRTRLPMPTMPVHPLREQHCSCPFM